MNNAFIPGLIVVWVAVSLLGASGALVGLLRRLEERGLLRLSGVNGRRALIAGQRVRLWTKRLGVFAIDLGIGLTALLALVLHAPAVASAAGTVTTILLFTNLVWEVAVVVGDLRSERRYLALAAPAEDA